jgi:aspartyl-tRNA(Asn)/glutamyl-tRNA(Gln) amidotransferase subunit A
MAIAWSMDQLGPMARCADDCGIILSVIAGHDPLDHDSLPFGIAEFHYAGPKSSLAGFRVGRLTNSWNEMEPGLAESVDDACRVLEKTGASVKDAAIPDGPFEEAAELTILMEATAAFDDLIQSGRCSELNDPLGQVNGYASRQFSAYDYVQVQRVRAHLQKRIDKLFDRFDVIVSAAQSSAAKPLGGNSDKEEREEESRAINQKAPDGISSLCVLPSISVPCGFSKSHLPFGLQFSARALNDEAVIRAAHVFQSHTDWHRQRPPHLD